MKPLVVAIIIFGFIIISALLRSQIPTPFERKPRCVFVDLGANIGDSAEDFLSGKFYLPEGYKPSDCELFLFEASPVHTPSLLKLLQKRKDVKITLFASTAATTENGPITFYLDTINPDNHYWGASLLDNVADVVKSGKVNITVQGMNIAHWLLNNFSIDDYVIVKVDIEGAEYFVLPHILEHHAYLVIDAMKCEFHGSNGIYSKDILIAEYKKHNIDIGHWSKK